MNKKQMNFTFITLQVPLTGDTGLAIDTLYEEAQKHGFTALKIGKNFERTSKLVSVGKLIGAIANGDYEVVKVK